MSGRKYLSGAAKRKIKDDKVKFQAKLPRLTDFFPTSQVQSDKEQLHLDTAKIKQIETIKEVSSISPKREEVSVQHEKIDDTTDKILIPCSGCSSDNKEVVANNIETVALSPSSLNESEYFYEFWREYLGNSSFVERTCDAKSAGVGFKS